MTPSPEAGELTPERLIEDALEWAKVTETLGTKDGPSLYRRLADALQATQARLECFEARAEWEGAEHDKFKSEELRQRLRAELAEQEASRCKAVAERAAEAARPILDEIALYEPSMGEDDDELVEIKLGDIKELRRALTSLRGDAT